MFFVPFSKDVVDREKDGDMRTRRVGIGIASIACIYHVVEGGSKGTEEPKDRSFNARGVGFGEFMENVGSTR